MGQQLGPIDECSGEPLKVVLLPGKNGRHITMDNPLALNLTSQDQIDLAWTGGLLDGEGSFNLHRRVEKGVFRRISFEIRMGNTNPKIVSEYIKILERFNIGFHQYKQQPRSHCKVATVVSVNRLKSIYSLCKLVEQYLRGKFDHCQIVMRFIESRLMGNAKKYNTPYTDYEIDLVKRLRSINAKGVRDCISSEK